jgi:hypothetical protein
MGPKGSPRKILVQTGDNHPQAAVGQFVAHFGDGPIEELGLVHGHNLGIRIQALENVTGLGYGCGLKVRSTVRANLLVHVARVHAGFKDLHLLLGDGGAFDPADQLFGLARKHGATDDLDPTPVIAMMGHGSTFSL